LKRLIGTGALALLFWHSPVGATLVSMDFTFQDYDFSVFPSGTGAGNVTFRVSYDSNSPDANGDPNIGSYTGSEVLMTGGKSSSSVPVTIDVFSNGSGDAGRDEFSVLPQGNLNPALPAFGIHIEGGEFLIFAPASLMFTNDHLPLTPAFVSSANFALVRIDPGEGAVGQGFGLNEFQVSSAPVPEPAACLLSIAGLIAMFSVLRGRQR
jgi:hypothetical protein